MEVSWDIIGLAGVLIMLLVYGLFLLHLQDTAKAVAPENRKLPSGTIWMQLIPVIGPFYSFTVAVKISDTIAAAYRAKGQVLPVERPAYYTGIMLAVLSVISSISEFFPKLTLNELVQLVYMKETAVPFLPVMMLITDIVWFVLWIIYWVQTSVYKKKIINLRDQLAEHAIFDH